jgi:hypothetical protein
MKLTPSKNAEKMAVQYLQHEFRKILKGINNPRTWKLIDKEISDFKRKEGEKSFWNLVAAISEDLRLNAIFRVLSDDKFEWRRKRIPIKNLVLTGMSPTINFYTIKYDRDPLKFKEAWFKDGKMRRVITKAGVSPFKEKCIFPIFVYEDKGKYSVFDGMHRTLIALISNKKEMDAWVGKPKNKNGKPLISRGFAYILSRIYAESERTPKTEQAMKVILKTIVQNRRNGKEVFRERIAKWSHDKKIKELFWIK